MITCSSTFVGLSKMRSVGEPNNLIFGGYHSRDVNLSCLMFMVKQYWISLLFTVAVVFIGWKFAVVTAVKL